jgi:vitamin B12 transporter
VVHTPQFNGKQEEGVARSTPSNLRCPRNGQADEPSGSASVKQATGRLEQAPGKATEVVSASPDTGQQGDLPQGGLYDPSTVGEGGEGVYLLVFLMKKSFAVRARVIAPALSLVGLACVSALAQNPVAPSADVTITANRRLVTADQTFQSVSVITREHIEESGAQSITDLLMGLPGVSIARNGGVGKASSVFLRGTTTSQLLVLIDGVRASAAGTGDFDWNTLLPEQIERIELVRGPAASLYGSDAVGGVLQIFRKEPKKGFSIAQTLGSYGTRHTDVSVAGGEDWLFGVNAGERTIDGMQTVVNNNNRYGSTHKYVSANVKGDLSRGLKMQGGFGYAEGDNADEYGKNLLRNHNGFIRLTHDTTPDWKQSLQLSQFGMNMKVPDGYPPGEFSTDRMALAWQNLLSTQVGLFTLGAETWADKVTKLDYANVTNNVYKTLTTHAAFAQYAHRWQDIDWQLGARRDQHNVYGDQSTFNAAMGKKLTPQLQLLASHGTAFKAPSANDLYWPHVAEPNFDYNTSPPTPLSAAGGTCGPNVGGRSVACVYDTVGNVSLKPERSKTSELGLRYSDGYVFRLNYFETQISDLIVWKSQTLGTGETYGAYYKPQNVSQADIKGLETSYSQRVGSWTLAGQYTRLLATNLDSGQQLDRRPKNSAALSASTAIQKHKITAIWQLASERLDSSGAYTLPGYGVLNLVDFYEINRQWSVTARVENVTNKKYHLATSFGTPYASPQRSGYVTLRYNYR